MVMMPQVVNLDHLTIVLLMAAPHFDGGLFRPTSADKGFSRSSRLK